MRKAILSLGLLIATASFGLAQTEKPLLLRDPALSKTQIAFVYAGDLWTVSREGGDATRLTTGPGTETFPVFSPDGTMIAFSGEYDGNIDVYVVPATGGVPRRLTYHPGGDTVSNWTPDGKNVLFVSGRNSESGRTGQLFTIPVDGVFPTAVPLPMAYDGSYSADGSQLAYEPLPRAFGAWKRYRGGRTSSVWIANLSDSNVDKIPRTNSNDFNPMWVGNRVYFLSDRNGPITLFAYDTKTRQVSEVIRNEGLDIKTASVGPDAIVYEQFGVLNLFDLKSGKPRRLNITISGDMLAVRPKYEKVGNRVMNAAISPTGARAVFEARGEILSVPAEKGNVRNLTSTSGIAERDPSWSPDGKWIAYFSDESGEYALHLRDQTGLTQPKKISLGNPSSFFYSPIWSPDSKKIAYTDKRLNLWYVDIDKGTPVKVDTSKRGGGFNPNWAPDSRWIAYTKPIQSWYSAVFVYSIEDTKVQQVTDGLSDAVYAAFDRNGKYLYFLASTDIGPAVFGFDMSSYPHRGGYTRSAYVCVLRKDLPSPLAPESDEEKIEAEKPAEGAEKKAETPAATPTPGKPADKKEPPRVTIDFDRIGQRILALPVPARNFFALVGGKANSLYIAESLPFGPGVTGATVHKFDMEKRKLDKVLDNVGTLEISANGEKMLFRQGENWFIAATAPASQAGRRQNQDRRDGSLR